MDKKHFANKLGKNASENSSLPGSRQIGVEQNRCAMACQGCGAVLLYQQIKSSGKTLRNSVLLSYHTKQLNTENPTAYEKNTTFRRLPQSEL